MNDLREQIDYDMDLNTLLEHAKVLDHASTADIWYEPQQGMYRDPDAIDEERGYAELIGEAQRSMNAVAQWIKTKWVERFAEKWGQPKHINDHPEGFLTDAEYATEAWATCPRCKGGEVEAGNMNVEGNEAWQEVTCVACGYEYIDLFNLIGYEEGH